MASELFVFENSFFSDPFSSFSDSSIDPQHDFFQTFEEDNLNNSNSSIMIEENSVDETTISLEQIASALLSSSPPSDQLENLSICKTAHNFPNATNPDYSALEVKTEKYQIPFDSITGTLNSSFVPQNCGNTAETAVSRLMQRSYSSNSFDGKPTNLLYHPRFDSLLESPNSQSYVLTPHETNFSSNQMRRVCSTGDLQVKTTPARNVLSSSPLSTEGSFMEEPNFKVGRYTAEERKERIHRYRAKRTQRNFNKTIKYACRKTLADNRPRIRGRFARNDETVEIPKASMFNRYEDEDDLWVDGYHEEDDEGSSSVGRTTSGGTFYNNFGSAQYQYYSY